MPSPTFQALASLGLPEGTIAIALGPNLPTAFVDSFQCRDALGALPAHVVAIVVNRATQAAITPVNLASALAQDCPRRDVYLWEDEPSGSLVSRARSANIRGVIDFAQLSQILHHHRPQQPSAARGGGAGVPAMPDEMESCGLDEPTDHLPSSVAVAPADGLMPLSAAPAAEIRPTPRPAQASQPHDGRPPNSPGNVVGVFSGRGGVGKSTVTLMLALAAAKRGLQVAIVDADLQFGDIAFLLGANHKQPVEVRPLLQELDSPSLASASRLLALTAPDNVEQSELLSDALPQIISQVAQSRQMVFVNTSAFWTASQAQLARTCSRLLLMMDQRATSIKACQRVLDLCIKLQIPEARFTYALNGCHRFAPISIQDASLALGGQEVISLEDGGALVDELLSLGCPWELLESGNPFVRSLDKLLDHLLPSGLGHNAAASSQQARASEPQPRGLFKGLFKRGVRDVA
jgi:pilus assembly protein CpaE